MRPRECVVSSWHLSTFSRAMYQDADIYLLDDLLSAVDATVSRHLFEKWVCSCFLSFLLSKSPVEMKEESSGRSLCSRRLSSLCPGVAPSPPFPPQKIHRREILHHDEVRTGKYSRCFQCVGASGVCVLGSDRWQFPSCYLQLITRHSGWIQMSGIRWCRVFKSESETLITWYLAASFFPLSFA